MPRQWISYHYAGPMHRFRSEDIDLLVTPDHRMLTQRADEFHRGPGAWQFIAGEGYPDHRPLRLSTLVPPPRRSALA